MPIAGNLNFSLLGSAYLGKKLPKDLLRRATTLALIDVDVDVEGKNRFYQVIRLIRADGGIKNNSRSSLQKNL